MRTAADKRSTFRALHARGCFVLPNPWSVGTARHLEALGYPALATTSAGVAFSRGLPDAAVPRDVMLQHLREIVGATTLPVNADYGDGFAGAPEGVHESVRLCVETGVAGLSIEDATGDAGAPLYAFDVAVARLRAARAAIDATGADVLLTGRSEGFVVGRPDLAETVRRLRAYAEAGADCVYAPGLHSREQIATVVKAVAPTPVNVLVSSDLGLTVADLEALGVRRISVGSALARVAWTAFLRSAREIAAEGHFRSFADLTTFAELDGFFRGG
jgi:2-methylisocitrate lyase-like PEP mutase family enzyme